MSVKQAPLLSTDLQIQSRFLGESAWVVAPRGSIDSSTSEEFKKFLDEIFQKNKSMPHLLLDMADVKYISSMGLGALIPLLKKSKENGSALALYDTQLAVTRVLEISKLDFLLARPDNLPDSHPFSEYVRSQEPERQKRREVAAEKERLKKEAEKKKK